MRERPPVIRKGNRVDKRKKKSGINFDMQNQIDNGQILGLAIGKRLRTYYDHIVAQPVPDRFVELLKRLEEKEGKKPR
jgi:hypothetical protein